MLSKISSLIVLLCHPNYSARDLHTVTVYAEREGNSVREDSQDRPILQQFHSQASYKKKENYRDTNAIGKPQKKVYTGDEWNILSN